MRILTPYSCVANSHQSTDEPEPSRLPHSRKSWLWRNPRWENKKKHRTWCTTSQQSNMDWFGSKDLSCWIRWWVNYQNKQRRNKWIIKKHVKCVGLKSKIWLWRMFWSYKAVYVQQNKPWAWVKIIILEIFPSMKRLLLLNKYFFIIIKIPIIYQHL